MENKDKADIRDVTFLIPVRVDSIERLENILMVTEYLTNHFNTNIHLLEATGYNNNILNTLLSHNVSLTYIEDHDPVFHRTKYINMMVKNSSTPYLAIWDADVIVPPEQIVRSVKYLRDKKAHFVFPYENNFLDTSKIVRELFAKTRNIDTLTDNIGKMEKLYLPDPVGGGFLATKTAYIESGMENENFYGWGREDGDRINRWKILGYKYIRVSGPLFHLTHQRGMNSQFHAKDQRNKKHSEILRILAMSKDELKAEIKSWSS